jgi:hypothetical protein
MSVPLHTSTTKIGWSAETNYAGGVAGDKYACTFVAAAASLTSMNMIKSLNVGIVENDRLELKPATAAPDVKVIFNKGYRYKEFTVEQYIQSATWGTRAKATITPGTINGTSYVFHCEILGVAGVIDYIDIFGCVMLDYEVSSNESDFLTEKITFSYYDINATDAIANTGLGSLLSTQPMMHKNLILSVDGDQLVDLIKCSFKITIDTIDKFVATKYQRFDPLAFSRGVTLEYTAYSDTAAQMGLEIAQKGALVTVPAGVAVVLTYFTGSTITAAKMIVDSTSIGEIPSEMGFYEMTVKMKSGAANTLS